MHLVSVPVFQYASGADVNANGTAGAVPPVPVVEPPAPVVPPRPPAPVVPAPPALPALPLVPADPVVPAVSPPFESGRARRANRAGCSALTGGPGVAAGSRLARGSRLAGPRCPRRSRVAGSGARRVRLAGRARRACENERGTSRPDGEKARQSLHRPIFPPTGLPFTVSTPAGGIRTSEKGSGRQSRPSPTRVSSRSPGCGRTRQPCSRCSACSRWASLLRLPTFGRPLLSDDEAIYATTADALERGDLLFRDVVDHKPPAVYHVYQAAFARVRALPDARRRTPSSSWRCC